MKIEFDAAKSEKNARERGLPFDLAAGFDFDSAHVVVDGRRNYGETRYRAVGRMGGLVAVLVFTLRGEAVRIISLRLANRKECVNYESRNEEED